MFMVADCPGAKRPSGEKLKQKRKDMIKSFRQWLKDQLKGIGFPRRKDLAARALEFAHENPNLIVIILDPKKDDIIAARDREYLITNIRSKLLNIKIHVISELLRGKDVDKNIDRILKVMDGFLYLLYKKLNPKKSKED